MTPFKHQLEISQHGYEILKNNGLVYLAMEERTGKTLTAILIAEMSKAETILVITKKKALEGWDKTCKEYNITKSYTCINYQSLHKISRSFDLIILDEAHANLSMYPKVGTAWKNTYKFTKDKPIIYLSATPSAQTYAQLYHQLKLSSWSPWIKYKNFYEWHRKYGIEKLIWLGSRQVKQYNDVKSIVYDEAKHLFITHTRKELGFEHEPNDIIHKIELCSDTKVLYNDLNKHGVIELSEDITYIADTPMKLLQGLYQLEGGTLKLDDYSICLANLEKINYIKDNFGDSLDLVIFYNFKQEEIKLRQCFKYATILQATSFAEGVDLSQYETLVIYSMDFSTARYSQRRARQANINRDTPIDVHYLLIEGGISEQVYNTVAVNKTNFIDKYFNRAEI